MRNRQKCHSFGQSCFEALLHFLVLNTNAEWMYMNAISAVCSVSSSPSKYFYVLYFFFFSYSWEDDVTEDLNVTLSSPSLIPIIGLCVKLFKKETTLVDNNSSNSVLDTVGQCVEDCGEIEEENIQDSSVFSSSVFRCWVLLILW